MGRAEYDFQDRLLKILRAKRYIVINGAKKQIFDIVAMKNQIAYPIEVKAKATPHPISQQNEQQALSVRSNTQHFIIRQSKKKGKMHLTGDMSIHYVQLAGDLEEYLIFE